MALIALTVAVPDQTGAARMVVNYATALRRRGHEVRVLHGPPPVDDEGRPRTILTTLVDEGVETHPVDRLQRPLPLLAERDLVRAAKGADAIVGFNQRDRATAARAAGQLRIPAVLAVGNRHTFWGPPPVPILKRWFYRRAVRKHVVLSICTSTAVEQELVEMGVSPDRCLVLRNGIELPSAPSPEERHSARHRLGLPTDTRIFMTVGRLDHQKGQDLLVEAWAAANEPCHNAHLLVVGGISEGAQASTSARFHHRLQDAIHHLDQASSISLLGWRDDVPDLLAAADVYVHPARWEGWPLAVMEAMAAGRPVIMTDCAGAPDGHEPQRHGPVIASGDAVALTDALRDFLNRPATELEVMGGQCRRLVEEYYDLAAVGERFVDHVEEAIDGFRRANEPSIAAPANSPMQ